MADPISIIGLVATVTHSCQKSYELLSDVKNQPHECQEMIRQIRTLTGLLEDIQKTTDPKSPADNSLISILYDLNRNINLIIQEVRPQQSRLARAGQRLGWPYKKEQVKDNLETLQGLQHSLSLAMHSQSREETRSFNATCNRRLDFLCTKEEVKDFEQVLDWICPRADTTSEYLNDLQSKWHGGSAAGHWFLESVEFNQWIKGNSNKIQILQCEGIAGSGKTFLTSIIIDHLKRSHPDVPMAYIFCNYDLRNSQDVNYIWAAILRQLLVTMGRCPESMIEAFRKDSKLLKSSSPRAILDCLQTVLNSQERVFIILDALDELKDTQIWLEIIETLLSWKVNPSFLITCRPNTFNRYPGRVSVTKMDIEPPREVMEKWVDGLLPKKITDKKKRKKICEKLAKNARGVYLIPKFQLEPLQHLTSNDLRQQLNKVLNETCDLPTVYDYIFKQINDLNDGEQLKVHRLFSWLITARHRLLIDELIPVLWVEKGDRELTNALDYQPLDLSDLSSEPEDNEDRGREALSSFDSSGDEQDVILEYAELLVRNCAGLVSLNPSTREIRLSHYTTLDFLQKKANAGDLMVNPQLYTAQTCLTYLSFDRLARHVDTSRDLRDLEERYRFLPHAALYLGEYLYTAIMPPDNEELESHVMKFLLQDARVSDIYVQYWTHRIAVLESLKRWKGQPFHPDMYRNNEKDVKIGRLTGLHVAIFAGLPHILRRLLTLKGHPKKPLPAACPQGELPLNYAAKLDRLEEAQVLLDHGADVNAKGTGEYRPIHWACTSGSLEMVKLLVNHGGDISVTTNGDKELHMNDCETPLHKACFHDRDEIAAFLLERQAPILPVHDPVFSSARRPGLTPIVYALSPGRENCRELFLFKKHLCTSQFMSGGEIPFEFTDDLRRLLNLYVSPDVIFGQGHGVLDIAILQHDPDLVQYGLETKVKPRMFWTLDSAEVAKFEGQEFYEALQDQIEKCKRPFMSFKRLERMKVSLSPEEPYLEFDIPVNIPQITSIMFTIVPHDQGWSSFPHDQGSYLGSCTNFIAVIVDSAEERRKRPEDRPETSTRLITFNVHASEKPKKHMVLWDQNIVSNGMQEWLAQLKGGKSVQVFAWPHENMQGWQNYVEQVQVDLFT